MWWELRRGSYNPGFRNFLESSPAPQVAAFVEGHARQRCHADKSVYDRCVIHRKKEVYNKIRWEPFRIILVRRIARA
jgi:hypothetical protein